jgi:hypothetical protein
MAARRRRIRHSAPTRYVFDTGISLAIERWLFHDGLSVNDGRLVALAPAVEEATGIRDRLLEELAASGLDADRALDRALDEAAEAFRSRPGAHRARNGGALLGGSRAGPSEEANIAHCFETSLESDFRRSCAITE